MSGPQRTDIHIVSPLGVSPFTGHCKGLGLFSVSKHTDSHACLHNVEITSDTWKWDSARILFLEMGQRELGHRTRGVGSAFTLTADVGLPPSASRDIPGSCAPWQPLSSLPDKRCFTRYSLHDGHS